MTYDSPAREASVQSLSFDYLTLRSEHQVFEELLICRIGPRECVMAGFKEQAYDPRSHQ